jgi:hypothetical protein
MAIQGTGTIDDPYLVTTHAELRAKVVEDFCYIKLKNDIDFNNDTVLWGWETLELKCAQIDGDNHKITNCYVYQKSFMTNYYGRNTNAPVVKNTIIEAIYFSGINQNTTENASFVSPYITYVESLGAIYFYDCDFRIKFYVEKDEALLFDTFYSASNTGYYYRRCIFNIDVFANNHQSITIFRWGAVSANMQGEVKNCEIKINLHLANSLFTDKKVFNTDTSSSNNYNTILRVFQANSNYTAIGFENNAVFINIDGVNKDLPTRLCIGLAYNGKNISNCYYILGDVKGSNYLAEKELDFKMYYEGIVSSCFVNDKATFYNAGLINKDPNMHVLTDAQCKNMQELLNIGFLVV